MKKYLRSIQTLFPFLHDVRFSIKFFLMRILKRPHEKDFYALRYLNIKSTDLLIDVGSNRGESILSIRVLGLKNPVIGFEPNPLIFNKLKRYFKDFNDVKLINKGLSKSSSHVKLFVPFYRKWMFDGLSSLHYENAANWLRNRLWLYNEKNLKVHEVECIIDRLDSFEFKPSFIKIDVQGHELDVLLGAEQTLKVNKPILLIESISNEVESHLNSIGYLVYCFDGSKFHRGKGSPNSFCIPDNIKI